MAHQEFGMQLMQKVRNDLSGMSQVEMEPKIAGRNVTMTLSPLPMNRRKRRFSVTEAEKETAPANGAVGDPANS
jgi:translation initiation factor IF-3